MKRWFQFIFKARFKTLTFCWALIGALLLSITFTNPSYSHWADLSVAEVIVDPTETQITLTFPTGLLAFMDDNKDNQLSKDELQIHNHELEKFLNDRIQLSDRLNQKPTLKIIASDPTNLPSTLKVVGSSTTHSTLELQYTWQKTIEGFKIRYNFFLPNVPTATCLTTILNQGNLENFTFSPINQNFPLSGFAGLASGNIFLAIAGAFVWGAMHALSPGHGKTIVGAYLAGAQATASHALILGLTTTITHTIGVFSLGLIALFAYQFVLPEQIYPWLNFISGLLVLAIGFNLFKTRSRHIPFLRKFSQKFGWHKNQALITTHDHQDPEHNHSHNYGHDHGDGHYHTHALPDEKINMKSLLALGVSGGILPCPAALVLMLSAISLGQVSLGLGLVLAFSLGLAMVLTVLGLILVSAKQLFEKLPNQVTLFKGLPIFSAFCISIIGFGISLQALLQITGVII